MNKKKNHQMTMDNRRYLLENIKNARQLTTLAASALETVADLQKEAANIAFENATNNLWQLKQEYEAGLPRIKLSRCPFTGKIVTLAIDIFGLDGLWWDSEIGIRPIKETMPSLFAFTGAIQLDDNNLPTTSFVCKPGPAVPFVTPRLLVEPGIKVVVSTTQIGNWKAFFIAYFSENIPHDILRINDWGLNHYVAEDIHGTGYHGKSFDILSDYDFNLEPWLRAGKLLWIEADDTTLRLRSTIGRCPYTNLQGRKTPVGLYNGKIWNSLIDQKQPEKQSIISENEEANDEQ